MYEFFNILQFTLLLITDFKWKSIRYEVIRRTIKTISDLISKFPQKTKVVPEKKSEDYMQCLVTFHILGTVSMDWHLIMDYAIRIR